MNIVFEDAQIFKRCIDAIAVLVEEAEFTLSEEGLSLKATDPSQISMIDFKMPKDSFKEFSPGKQTKIGLDLGYLSQVMARAKAGEELILELDPEKSRMNLMFKGASTRSFMIPLIDVSGQDLPQPKIEFDAELKVKGGTLQDAFKDAALISTHLTLGANAEGFYVKANSSKGELNNETAKGEMTAHNVKEECSAMYPLDYLQDMLKAVSSAEDLNLNLKANAPVQINYNIGPASVTYYLAPRIEN
jgi:proliferating cell nuclear antigen